MSGYYLLDHPNPACPDRGDGRYWGYAEMAAPVSWVTVHTAESFADLIGVDMGAENVAAYFTRTDVDHAASYHTLCDSDSTVRCLPAGLDGTTVHTAFHCYQRNTGNLGVSAAIRAVEWTTVPPDWAAAVLDRLADETARWCVQHRIPMEIRTLADVNAGIKGITGHGIIQPVDRTDPGTSFPWQRFIDLVRFKANGAPPNQPEEEMPEYMMQMRDGGTLVAIYPAGTGRPIGAGEYRHLTSKGVPVVATADVAEDDRLRSYVIGK
jgi:hypothetical protein